MAKEFDNRVAIVTGAGRGLGRQYAIELASRGAQVVVNDVGTSIDGQGVAESNADKVVEEIRAAGGTAVANFDDVSREEGAAALVEAALSAFGTVDILVTNAGIIHNQAMPDVTAQDFVTHVSVHVFGSFFCSRAVWPIMKAKKYGRILNVSSACALFGSEAQASYCAAKGGVLGLMQALAADGKADNILVNAICPMANSRMTEGYFSGALEAAMQPEFVSPMAAYLVSEQNKMTGQIISAGMGYFAQAKMVEAHGALLDRRNITPDEIAKRIDEIMSLEGAEIYHSMPDYLERVCGRVLQTDELLNDGWAPGEGAPEPVADLAGRQ